MARISLYCRVCIVAMLFCLRTAVCSAATPAAGAQLLEMVPDARTTALGKTFVGMAGDITSLFYNPAGLANVAIMEVPMAKNYYMQNISQEYVGFATSLRGVRSTNVDSLGTIAANYMTIETDDIVSRDDAGNPGGSFKAEDTLITVGYGKTFVDSSSMGKFMGGFSVKMFSQEIQGTGSQGEAFDVGTLWKAPGKLIYAGLALQNVGSPEKFISEKYELPSALTFGISGGMFDNACIVGMDFKRPLAGSFDYSAGAEYWFHHTVALRFGYNSATLSAGNGLSAGFGVCLMQTDLLFLYAGEVNIDYAFIPYGDLGDSHRFSILIKMGAE